MLDRLLTRTGRFAVRRRRAVLLLALAFAIVAGAVGGGVFARLGNAGFQDPSAPSSQALASARRPLRHRRARHRAHRDRQERLGGRHGSRSGRR